MNEMNIISKFLSLNRIAVVGVSEKSNKFGNMIFKTLKRNGKDVLPVNKNLNVYDDQICYKDISSVPGELDGVVTVVKPTSTLEVIKESNKLGIKNIWMQQGSQSKDSVEFCRNNNINIINGKCMLMFFEDEKFPHNIHRWIVKLTGKYPK